MLGELWRPCRAELEHGKFKTLDPFHDCQTLSQALQSLARTVQHRILQDNGTMLRPFTWTYSHRRELAVFPLPSLESTPGDHISSRHYSSAHLVVVNWGLSLSYADEKATEMLL